MRFKKYLKVFTNSWQLQLAYRFDFLSRFFVAFVSLISVFYLWNDIFGNKASLMGYSKPQIITYYIVVAFLYSAIYVGVMVTEDIQSGHLSSWLTRPINYIWAQYWHTLARRFFRVLVWSPLVVILFAVLHKSVYIVLEPKYYILMIITSFLAINIFFLFDVLINLIEFWVLNSYSISMITESLTAFFAGTLIPLAFLPDYVNTIGAFLPFKYTVYFIANTFLGRNSTTEVLYGILMQIVWIIILALIVSLVWKHGLKRYEAYGA